MTSKTERLLYVEEVAEMLRKTPSSLRYMVHKGDDVPRSAKIGGRRMWRESDVIAWLDAKFEEAL